MWSRRLCREADKGFGGVRGLLVRVSLDHYCSVCRCTTAVVCHCITAIPVQERGAGYWLWRPYIILKTLLYEMEEGDLLLYADSGSEAIGDLRLLFELAEEDDIIIFQTPPQLSHPEKERTKPDSFVIMGCPVDQCGGQLQVRPGASTVLYTNCTVIYCTVDYRRLLLTAQY